MLIARDTVIAESLQALVEGKTVAILGGVGTGKTTLGAAISNQWPHKLIFWYTFRPGLNDQITSLFFSLGHFFNRAGASSLWLQLVADHGRTALPLAEGLLRHDIETLGSRLPLLCFDEADVLRPEELESHAQLIVLLTSLSEQVPMLLIGQATRPQRLLQVDVECLLDPLTTNEVGLLLEELGVKSTPEETSLLTEYTQGNLRLLHLWAAVWRQGTSLEEIVTSLPKTPQVETIIQRLYQKLRTSERQLLRSLCIFNQPVPADVWDEDSLWRLQTAGLVQRTACNTVEVLAPVVPIVHNLMTDDERRECHLRAAQVWEGHGLFTACAHHYAEADCPDRAVALWLRHKYVEIDQGRARPALGIFDRLANQSLNLSTREQVTLIRGELQMILGELDKACESLAAATWQRESRFQVAGSILKAEVGLAQGNNVVVQHDLEDDIAQALSIIEGLPLMYVRLSNAHLNSGDLAAALRKTQIAECEVQSSQGSLYQLLGDYSSSRRCFTQALKLAEALGDKRMAAKVRIRYAELLSNYSQKDEALSHLEEALTYYQQIGDFRLAAHVKCSLAAVYTSIRRLPESIELANDALNDFQRLDPAGVARAAYALTLIALGFLKWTLPRT